jgi:CheY-like chemotaxis protein
MANDDKSNAPHALIVEDEDDIRSGLVLELQQLGFVVHEASNPDEGHDAVARFKDVLDLIIVDLALAEEGAGWAVANRARRKQVPARCAIAIYTGYKGGKRATEDGDLEYFIKIDDDDKFELFLERTAKCAIERRCGTSQDLPQVESRVSNLLKEEELACQAIAEAGSVVILDRFSGSLQNRSVLLVEVTPKTGGGHSEGGAPYHAVLKQASMESCRREEDNAKKLNRYVGENSTQIRIPSVYMSLNRADEATMVSPVGGYVTLEAMIRKHWIRSEDTKREFLQICERLRRFLTDIAANPKPCRHDTRDIVNQRLDCRTSEGARRLERSVAVIREMVPTSEPLLEVEGLPQRIVNPRYVLENLRSIPWDSKLYSCKKVTYGHGDFHLRNIVDTDFQSKDQICIVDFEHVAPDQCQHFDTAQLEASFLLAVSDSESEFEPRSWRPAIKLALSNSVTGSTPNGHGYARRNKAADTEIAKAIGAIRGSLPLIDMPLYSAALWPAMLRLSVGLFEHERERFGNAAIATAVICMGLHLRETLAAKALKGGAVGRFDA